MPRYRVGVYVQYDDYVEVEADTPDEARELAEEEALSNIVVFASIDVRVHELEEIT